MHSYHFIVERLRKIFFLHVPRKFYFLFLVSMHYIPSIWGLIIALLLLSIIIFWWIGKKNALSLLIGEMFEWMNGFFATILEDAENAWTTKYITSMFFVIWMYNVLGLLTDFIAPIFWYNTIKWEFYLAEYIWFATSDYHFNIAMAAIGVLIMLWVQFANMPKTTLLWKNIRAHKSFSWLIRWGNMFYEYIPFFGKDIIALEKWSVSKYLYYPLWIIMKLFDIIISLFVWFLDIIWLFAKIVSLSFRLFGNMLAWTALLTVLIWWLGSSTLKLLWFEFPVLWPILLFVQWLLVACIQAFVFPLLIAIFIKVARVWAWEEETTQTV